MKTKPRIRGVLQYQMRILSSTALTLIVWPVLYSMFGSKSQAER